MLANLNLFSDEFLIIITALLAIVNFVFKAIGLYVIAKRKKLTNRWMAFIPFANSYLLGKITGEINLINVKIKNSGLMLLLTELLKFIFVMAFYVLFYMPVIKEIIAGDYTVLQFISGSVEREALTTTTGIKALEGLSSILSLSYIFLFVSVLISFFRKFSPNNYMIYSIISLFLSIEGIFIFVVRNKEEVNYNEYLKKKYAQYRQNPYNPYNPNNRGRNPNDIFNPYNRGQGGQNINNNYKPEDPFAEFSEKKDSDPFSDFTDNKKEYSDTEKPKEEEKPEKKDDDVFH